jgi:hypothetical protein
MTGLLSNFSWQYKNALQNELSRYAWNVEIELASKSDGLRI